jgi:hypothetical protein
MSDDWLMVVGVIIGLLIIYLASSGIVHVAVNGKNVRDYVPNVTMPDVNVSVDGYCQIAAEKCGWNMTQQCMGAKP